MIKLIPLLVVALLGAAVHPAPAFAAEPAGETTPDDATLMQRSFKAEAEQMQKLAGLIKKDVTKKKVSLTDDAQGKWDAGSAQWAEIKSLAEQGKKQEAYEGIRALRKLFGETLLTGFTGKASKATRKAAEGWWLIDAARAEHIIDWGKNHTLTDANKASFERAVTLWTGAKGKKEKKDFRGAFTDMLQAIDALDHVMWNAWQAQPAAQ